MAKLNITSTVLERSIDLAKDFLGKLIMPTIEETGLLIKDQVTRFRFNNQVKMLNKAKLVCEQNGIRPKNVSLKLLAPLLEYSSIEEDEVLQDKWAILLSNLVDSEQNIENHVFPYILSQLSRNEFNVFEKWYNQAESKRIKIGREINKYDKIAAPILKSYEEFIKEYNRNFPALEKRNEKLRANGKSDAKVYDKLKYYRHERVKYSTLIGEVNDKYESLSRESGNPIEFVPKGLKGYEVSNLLRLALIKIENEVLNKSPKLRIPEKQSSWWNQSAGGGGVGYVGRPGFVGGGSISNEDFFGSYTDVDLNLEMVLKGRYFATELGVVFMKACKEKKSQKK